MTDQVNIYDLISATSTAMRQDKSDGRNIDELQQNLVGISQQADAIPVLQNFLARQERAKQDGNVDSV